MVWIFSGFNWVQSVTLLIFGGLNLCLMITTNLKNVSELGVTFEERLAQLGKLSKHSRGDGKNARTPISNQQNRGFGSADASDTSVIANPKSRAALDEYKQRGQSKQILKVWFMLMQAFGSKLKHFFGDEPDVHFMKFAVSLTADSYKRLEANLLERLDEDREWPPSLIRLRQLAESPTKEMMYRARQKTVSLPCTDERTGSRRAVY